MTRTYSHFAPDKVAGRSGSNLDKSKRARVEGDEWRIGAAKSGTSLSDRIHPSKTIRTFIPI